MLVVYIIIGIVLYLYIAHFVSFHILKNITLKSQKWDLNICCGKTDGRGTNADIVKLKDVPKFVLIKDIYKLPFKENQFENVLCSHTIEHVDNPLKLYKELKRVGKNVVIVVPPLWDILAHISVLHHKWIFLTFKKDHDHLPKHIPIPFAEKIQKTFGQRYI